MPQITQFSLAAALDGTEVLAIVQGGVTVKAPLSDVVALAVAGGSPVDSVNGQTGTVVLAAADVGADPTGTAVTEVSNHNADPGAHGGVQVDLAAHRFVGGVEHPDATTLVAGFMSAADKAILDGLAVATQVGMVTDIVTASGNLPLVQDKLYMLDTTLGALVMQLPKITPAMNGLTMIVKFYLKPGANNITVNADGTDLGLIDGAAALSLTQLHESYTLVPHYIAANLSFWNIT